jgi:hypothetical protein
MSLGGNDYIIFTNMLNNIGRFANTPHESGSAAIETVRADILAEIESMGYTPIVEDVVIPLSEIQTQKDIQGDENGNLHLKNILVEPLTTGDRKGVLFVSHYDSVPTGPGAGDDMVAVASMLEAMRSLTNDTINIQTSIAHAPINDLYFLITDGEEYGLLGADAFVKTHPELKDKIDLIVNVDNRGNSGAILLYETSKKAYNLIRMVKNSGARPAAFSFAAAVYEYMPNGTDFTMFINSGYQGINMASIGNVASYHQQTDDLEHLNRSTAWHYLQTIVKLVHYTANNPLPYVSDTPKDAVYFPFFPGNTVLVTMTVANIFAVVACLLAVILIIVLAMKKALKPIFPIIVMIFLIILTLGLTLFFGAAGYLASIPLLLLTITRALKQKNIPHLIASMVSGILVLLLWVPVLMLVWQALIEPTML